MGQRDNAGCDLLREVGRLVAQSGSFGRFGRLIMHFGRFGRIMRGGGGVGAKVLFRGF
jgi:hypothetical protein